MYCAGITKVLLIKDAGSDLLNASELADKAGYKALAFNGIIYIKSKEWVKTPFLTSDFSTHGESFR